jgi:protocatechuate 3,4-dioxygenase beta subunit
MTAKMRRDRKGVRSSLQWIGCILPFLCASPPIDAGVIKGSVIEYSSGRPLARSVVRLQPVQKNGGALLQIRADRGGAFVFPVVPSGLYLIIATREYYFPASFGQRRPSGQGVPVEITTDSNIFAELRMRRMGVVTGTVLDENDVGMANAPVVAYRAKLPLQAVGRGISDDRGVYRIFNLEPGKYWVRTAPYQHSDGSGWLPTFGPETTTTRDAAIHEVRVDYETAYANLRPTQGRLFRMGGIAQCPVGSTAKVTLSSEVERKTTVVGCGQRYQFDGLAPASYEVFAESTPDGYAGFIEQFLDRDSSGVHVSTGPLPRVTVEYAGRMRGSTDSQIAVFGHRQDLADLEKDQPIALSGPLAPGHWLMNARVGPTQYVESITSSSFARERRSGQASDAFDVIIQGGTNRITISVSDRAAQMEGTVTGPDAKPVAGAPVFIWPMTEMARRSLGGAKLTLADGKGHYQFTGLPPGDYRVLATFDASEGDQEIADAARVPLTRIDASQRLILDLALWIAP